MSAEGTKSKEMVDLKSSLFKHKCLSSGNILHETKRDTEYEKDRAVSTPRKILTLPQSRQPHGNLESQNFPNEDRIHLSARKSQTLQAIKMLSSMDVILPDKEKLNVLNAPIYDEALNEYDESLSKKDRPIVKWIYFLRIFIVWIIFLLVGTVFYTYYDEFGWQMGFYMAINVGYSIGWGYPLDPNEGSEWFSVCYIIFGATIALAGVVFLIRLSLENRKSW